MHSSGGLKRNPITKPIRYHAVKEMSLSLFFIHFFLPFMTLFFQYFFKIDLCMKGCLCVLSGEEASQKWSLVSAKNMLIVSLNRQKREKIDNVLVCESHVHIVS